MGVINEEMIENLSKKDLSYSRGSTRQAFLVQNSILKLPRYSGKFNLSFKYDVNDIIKFNVYLRGVNQMLKEIQIYEEGLFNDIVVPIEEYGVLNGQLYTLNKKIMPSNICLDDEDFNLQYFCTKMGCLEDYPYLIDRIEELADMLEDATLEPIYEETNFESHIIYKFKNEKPYTITNDNGVWVLEGDEIEKLFKMTKFTEEYRLKVNLSCGDQEDYIIVYLGCYDY